MTKLAHESTRRPWRVIFENGIIVLGLLSFWPLILGYRGFWSQCGILAVLALLAALAVVRFRRVKRAFEQERGSQIPGSVEPHF